MNYGEAKKAAIDERIEETLEILRKQPGIFKVTLDKLPDLQLNNHSHSELKNDNDPPALPPVQPRQLIRNDDRMQVTIQSSKLVIIRVFISKKVHLVVESSRMEYARAQEWSLFTADAIALFQLKRKKI